ncbi:hypothetical protein AWB82_04412 [Caballeronia glebae]|uniref:Uncharacterized protein n=1 Tax=Caballeronia glebae TaxID=1777143 RepID=A0A158BR69_9BURK|nr:DUF4150 domain-containing protein [Caballeronia glebae]SAK72186.1 hypothetical protein AWB82_04412 [Caballeronia glebae]
MVSVGVNPPKTPVTEGSFDQAPATLPNVCKMPGPPAPFVPTPLPNLGRSADRLKDATTTVKIEGNTVAIKGSHYMSQPSPDVASQGTGGGIVSSKTQGKTEFIAPGSMTVKAEGKNIQLLGDAMTNNGGSPANSGCVGNQQSPQTFEEILKAIACKCDKQVQPNKQSTCRELGTQKHDCCDKEIQKRKNKTGPGRHEQLAPERGYTNPYKPPATRIKMTRFQSYISRANPRSCWPDAMLLDEKGNPKQLFDFKFRCPAGTRSRRKKDKTWSICDGNQDYPTWTKYKDGTSQLDKFVALGQQLGIDNEKFPPAIINNAGC